VLRQLFILFFLIHNVGLAQSKKSSKIIAGQLEDLAILKRSLLNTTGKPFAYTDSATFNAAFNAAELILSQPRNAKEQFLTFSKLVALTNCGHTNISPSKELFRLYFSYYGNLNLPMQVFNRKLFASGNYGKKVKIKKGDEILAINQKPVEQILDDMYEYISSDGYNTTFKDFFLRDLFSFYYYLTQDTVNEYDIAFRHRTRIDTLKISEISFDYRSFMNQIQNNPMLNPSKKPNYGEFKLKKSSGYAYFKFTSFYHLSGKKYFSYLDNCFTRINQSEVPFVIIDVRGNLGGQPQTYLMSYFIDDAELVKYGYGETKPFEDKKYVRMKMMGEYRHYKKVLRKKKKGKMGDKTYSDYTSIPNFKGKVVLLTDGGSFSASANLAANLKSKANCYIIGEETGGNEDQGNTGNLVLKLPNTKFYITINPFYFNNCVYTTNTLGVEPDLEMPNLYQIKKRNDPQMKAAIKYIKQNKKSVELTMK